jgi:probable rRNA maturation factor
VDIYISIDRVEDNAGSFNVEMDEELRRVMIHGVLHLMGYTDGTEEEKRIMRIKENEKMELFHVEQ